MISKELKDWKYYYDKFPLYFKNDEKIIEHFKILYDLLVTLDDLSEDVFKYLDIFNTTNNFIMNSKVLDLIGSIFGVYRNITFDFTLTITEGSLVKTSNAFNITLSDEEFLTLIKCQIFNNNYNGTYEEVNNFYESVDFIKLFIINGINPAEAKLFIAEKPIQSHINYYYLLYAELLTIKSMGIEYSYEVSDELSLLYWDVNNWNEGRWS